MASGTGQGQMLLCVVVEHGYGADEPGGLVYYSILLLQFTIFTFIRSTASGSCMLLQKGTVYILAKEIPLCPVEVQGAAGSVDEGVKTEQTISTRYRMHLLIRCFPVCA